MNTDSRRLSSILIVALALMNKFGSFGEQTMAANCSIASFRSSLTKLRHGKYCDIELDLRPRLWPFPPMLGLPLPPLSLFTVSECWVVNVGLARGWSVGLVLPGMRLLGVGVVGGEFCGVVTGVPETELQLVARANDVGSNIDTNTSCGRSSFLNTQPKL